MMRKLLLAASAVALAIAAGPAHAGDCGRPVTKDGNISKASDALFILRSSVGSHDCRLEDCDVNTDCQVSASDALVALKNSVNATATNDSCQSECPTLTPCGEAAAPECNGVCPEGEACVVSDEEGDKRVTICHIPPGNHDNPQTIVVGAPAVPAHLAHGDYLGPCDDSTSPGGETEGDTGSCKKPGGCDKSGKDRMKSSAPSMDEPSCLCQPIAITTTTVPATTTTVIAPTTTLPEPTTTLPTPTTTLPEPTTTLPTPTTTLPEPTTTLPTPTTTLPEPTTTLPTPTTTVPEPTTTVPETTTTVPETTTTLLATTTTVSESTTTSLAATTTTMGGGSIEAGQALYDNSCSSCHMAGSHDTTGFAGDLAGKGDNVVSDLGTIDNAMNGITLTDQQVADLSAFLNSL